MKPLTILGFLALLLGVASAAPTEDGLYATFKTSRGTFTAQLDYDKAPHVVANFIGLAEGTRPWIDFSRGTVSTRPFYNGIIFHRVISGFMIQGGSPNKQGTDGPGYAFGDEFHTSLHHNSSGVLSMANSGPASNGSQFFITLEATAWLDSKHSVFGHITEGMAVVEEIGANPTPDAYTPDFDYTTIETVTITAIGTAARAFHSTPPPGLPLVVGTSPSLARHQGTLELTLPRPALSKQVFFRSSDLANWLLHNSMEDFIATNTPFDLTAVAEGKSKEFYRIAQVRHTPRPQELIGKTLTLDTQSSGQVLVLNITGGEGYPAEGNSGTMSLDGSAPSPINAYYLDPTLGTLTMHIDFGGLYTFALNFSDESHGWFTAQPYGALDGLWPIFGTFQIQNTPIP